MSFTNLSTSNSPSFGGEYLEIIPNELLKYTDQFDDPHLPGQMITTIQLKSVLCGTELFVTQEGIPDSTATEMCCLGWQEPLDKLKRLVEPNIPDAQQKYCHTLKEINMAQINPHINFNGNAEEAFTFYKSVFGGEFAKIMRFKDLSSSESPVAENDGNKIMHIALPIGKNTLMANDVPEIMGRVNENENRSKISISAESKDEADKLFNGLSEGGKIEMPIADSPWGSYFGMFRDKYGIEWMVDFDPHYSGQM